MVVRSRRAIPFLALVVGILGCAGDDPSGPAAPSIAHLLPPAADLAGWIVAEGPAEYSPDTIYEYLNGGAERYQSHGFRQLLHIRYQLGEDPLACVTLDVYDMGSELGAFGIYSAVRPAGREPRQWGAEGYRTGTIAAAYRGSIFVHGEADDRRQELVEMLEDLVSRVAGGADGSVLPPAILAPLPAAHRLAGNERYVSDNLLGHSFLPGGVLASYEIDGRQAELFFADVDTEARAINAITALRAHFEDRDAILDGDPPIGDGGFRIADRVFGQGTVVRNGRRVAGIHGELPIGDREEILRLLIAGGLDDTASRSDD